MVYGEGQILGIAGLETTKSRTDVHTTDGPLRMYSEFVTDFTHVVLP
jgi:hypothetical protein